MLGDDKVRIRGNMFGVWVLIKCASEGTCFGQMLNDIQEKTYLLLRVCEGLAHYVRTPNTCKNTYKSKEIYNKAFFSPKEGVILLIMEMVDE